jgi:hypothetical protein
MLTALFGVARIVANPISNVFQKQLARRAANPVFIIAATHLVSVLLGHRYFQERNIGRRLFGSAVMVAGAALIVTLGRRG